MSKIFNKKGMTLVEITVVLLIASILMTITGGILINSLGYFQDTTELSTDKSVGDGILDFINSEIEYSSDVRVQEIKPDGDNWNSIYVVNGQLYRNEKAVFGEDYYYNKRKLEIDVNGFKNGYRLDMKIYLKKNDEIKYRISHTFEFLNLKKTKEADNTYNPFSNVLTNVSIVDEINTEKKLEKYRVWYKRDYSEIKPDEEEPDNSTDIDQTKDGTVADIIFNIDASNYWGVYQQNHLYDRYDIVWYNNAWWQYTAAWANGTVLPGNATGGCWKKLDREFSLDSIYEYGDIVIYDNCYYQMSSQYTYAIGHTPDYTSYKQWDCLGSITDKDVVNEVKKNTYQKYASKNMSANITKKYMSDDKYSSVLQDNKKEDFDEYQATESYKKGQFIKMKSQADSSFYELWYACIDNPKVPGNIDSGWIKMENNWDQRSTYLTGDIVYALPKTANLKANVDIFQTSGSLDSDIYNQHYWDVIY